MDLLILADRYEKNPVLRALARLISGGSAMEVAMLTHVNRIREKRLRIFFDELAIANAIDNPELLDSEDFLHHFMCTTQFALNTKRREKIQMFGRLLESSTSAESELADQDEYEDFLGILDELSYRELRALTILDSFSGTIRYENQHDTEWADTFWDDFCQRLSEELPLPIDEVPDFMRRTARTGCFHELTGYVGGAKGVGMLTPRYFRLVRLVSKRA